MLVGACGWSFVVANEGSLWVECRLAGIKSWSVCWLEQAMGLVLKGLWWLARSSRWAE